MGGCRSGVPACCGLCAIVAVRGAWPKHAAQGVTRRPDPVPAVAQQGIDQAVAGHPVFYRGVYVAVRHMDDLQHVGKGAQLAVHQPEIAAPGIGGGAWIRVGAVAGRTPARRRYGHHGAVGVPRTFVRLQDAFQLRDEARGQRMDGFADERVQAHAGSEFCGQGVTSHGMATGAEARGGGRCGLAYRRRKRQLTGGSCDPPHRPPKGWHEGACSAVPEGDNRDAFLTTFGMPIPAGPTGQHGHRVLVWRACT